MLYGRSEGSVEFKHQNISAVLKGLGEDWIPGNKPTFNFQMTLGDAVARRLARNIARLEREPGPRAAIGLREVEQVWIAPPPTQSNARWKAGPASLRRFRPSPRVRPVAKRPATPQCNQHTLYHGRNRVLRKFHFISGLPRSGSTMLSGILLQNPRFHAGMTSPVFALVQAAIRTSSGFELSVSMTEEKCARLVRGIFNAYYDDAGAAEVILDTNRNWTAEMPLLAKLMPGFKMIACVRNPAWIVDSVEQLVRRNPLQRSRMFNNDSEHATVFTRSEAILRPDRLVGSALSALRQGYYGAEARHLLLVEYDILCQRPRETMRLIYQFLDEPWFEHDFDAVSYEAEAFDLKLNTPGLHTVRRKVTFEPRDTILPPDLFKHLAGQAFWRGGQGTKAHVIRQEAPGPDDPA